MSATRRAGLALALLAAAAGAGPAGAGPEQLRRDVEFLAAETLEGRLTGSEGERRAADYLVGRLEALGASPLPGTTSLRLPFEFTAGSRDGGSRLASASGTEPRSFQGEELVRALSFSEAATVRGPVVFAGYGLVVPADQGLSYDSYAGLDVKDRIVLVLRYSPEQAEESARSTLARYSALRYKAMLARERGARALLVVSGPASPNAGRTVEMGFDAALSGSGLVAASIGGPVADWILSFAAGRDLGAIQRELDAGNPHVAGFAIPGLELEIDARVERERRQATNVVGLLPAQGEPAAGAAYVLLGAHYDHLGHGAHGNSLARKEETGQVHPGADDNASGVATLLDAALRLAAQPRTRGVILAFWSGEELGLLGSTEFVKRGPLPATSLAAYVNLDMVGRMRDNKLTLQGAGSSTAWRGLVEQANVAVGFDVGLQDDPYLPTDSTALYQEGVPTLNLFTGGHEDYHRPTDRAATINYADLERVAEFTARLAGRLAQSGAALPWAKVEPTQRATGGRDGLRAYTGTIPDYTSDVKGLRLSGVVGGGPADRAGLREGDVIVEFGGRTIENVYDYTYALEAARIGVAVRVAVLRGGSRLELTLTPTARP